MYLRSHSFQDGEPIPSEFAFSEPAAEGRVRLAGNRSPHLAWGDLPAGTRSIALLCVDVDVPSRGDDVNQPGRTVPADLPRVDFYHWVMIDVPVGCTGLEVGASSDGVTPRGKEDPAGPDGARQGVNDYTGWFAGDAEMAGTYRGYDGPGPPWNDELVHRYEFRLLALDLEHTPVGGDFSGADVLAAIAGHVLGSATHVGTYTQNPALL